MSELEQVTRLCEKLGAPSGQAATMAAQLLKRADQLSVGRGIPREAALAQLLQILVQARQGGVPPEFPPPAPASE